MATADGSRAGTKITLAAATYTDITTQFELLGDSVYVLSDLVDLEIGLVTNGETPSALPEVDTAGEVVKISKSNESTLEVYAHSTIGGDIYLVVAEKHVVFDTTGTTSA